MEIFSPIWDLVSCGIILLSVCLVPDGGSVAGRIKFAGAEGCTWLNDELPRVSKRSAPSKA